jgi:hypothetical protein
MLNLLGGISSSLGAYLVVGVVGAAGGAYLASEFEVSRYEAKIERMKADQVKEKADREKVYADAYRKKEAEYHVATSNFYKGLQNEQSKTIKYEKQVVYVTSPTTSRANSLCVINNGFVRLFNASASGMPTEAELSDSDTSEVDLTTLLSTIIENNGKYRQLVNQVLAIQEVDK